ncbi:concanavalin A-like lectin/glucanase domain-containing protein [Hysterangium stoloniferum]|nr:concanavalin A-like lectin/glucanase domain-containing protein [Hysterangium stoloniferum]
MVSLAVSAAWVLSTITLGKAYSLSRSYTGEDFMNDFDFWDDGNANDPTGSGSAPSAAYYMPRSAAQSQGLVWMLIAAIGLSVDSTHSYGGDGLRPSVRISSQSSIHHGLLILDAVHLPYGHGTWPAFWLSGADGNWPYSGEIDLIEGVNNNVHNTVSYHTGPGVCSYDTGTSQSGSLNTQFGTDCNALENNDETCGNTDPSGSSYGNGANDVGGGVWAMEWTSSHIKTWHFNRDSIPTDISHGKPNPQGWGRPVTNLDSSNCDIDQAFGPQSIVFNIELCGTWAGNVFDGGPQACVNYVQHDPGAFNDAYFEIKSLKYYQ